MAFAHSALASARSDHSEDPIGDRYRMALMQRLLGDALERSGQSAGAAAQWKAALAQLPANVAERPREMSERAELLRRVGRGPQAAALSARLNAIGYRLRI
jgi:hypothetical protein